MLRSILVALDATPASEAAQSVAISLAKKYDAAITGVAVLDRSHITAPAATGIGGIAYKKHRDEVKLHEAKTFLTRLEEHFQKTCEADDLIWQVIEVEGVPYKLIELESGRHDLLVIGRDTDFHLDESPSLADMVNRLIRDNPRPLIVCPDSARPGDVILATADGSHRSSRALHMLALLGPAAATELHVLAIDDEQEVADQRAAYFSELFLKHGFNAVARGIRASGDPADMISKEAAARGASLVALGASGQSTLHDFFLGSTTERLLNHCPCALFLHH